MLFDDGGQVVFIDVLNAIDIAKEIVRQDNVDIVTSDIGMLLEHFKESAEIWESGRAGLSQIR